MKSETSQIIGYYTRSFVTEMGTEMRTRLNTAIGAFVAISFISASAWATGNREAAGRYQHLEPEYSFFDDPRFVDDEATSVHEHYNRMVVSVFKEVYRESFTARVIAQPFNNESTDYAVGLRQREDDYEIVYLQAGSRLQLVSLLQKHKNALATATPLQRRQIEADIRDLQSRTTDDPNKVEIRRCERELPAKTGREIHRLWVEMLRGTRYPHGRLEQEDGVTFYRVADTGFHFSAVTATDDPTDQVRMAGQIWSPPEDSNTGRFVAIVQTMQRYCQEGDNEQARKLDRQVKDLWEQYGKR